MHGYVVLPARDGAEALVIAGRFTDKIDLLVTDVVLSGQAGRGTHEALLTTHPEARVLYVSGHGDTGAATPLLTKPFTLADFLDKVREALDEGSAVEAAGIP